MARLDEVGLAALAQACASPEVVARWRAKIVHVEGSECAWWTGAVSGRGHGRFWLASGRVVNLAAGEGHPASVMDLSFALQVLSVLHLAREGAGLTPGLRPVPEAIDREIARLKLASLGVELDTLNDAQREYLRRWR